MKLLLISLMFISGFYFINSNRTIEPATQNTIIEEPVESKITYHTYPPSNIPDFFKELTNNHFESIFEKHGSEYLNFCSDNQIDANDLANKKNYLTVWFLHQLFTTNSASDCSNAGILKIPYFWHWINPNPRHEIKLVKTGIPLTQVESPTGYKKYRSYADLDRKPFLYLSDLLAEHPKFYAERCDTFSTFGWCSEREMAFVALTTEMGFTGKVFSEGAHSISKLKIPMTKQDGQKLIFDVTVDNTFYNLEWNLMTPAEISKWDTTLGNIQMAKWYNDQAHLSSSLTNIRNYQVSMMAMDRIERLTANFFKN
ncbi:MAG: hypothetical protein IPM47_12170 [Sphingobacteriales bacterium]|nr:MAG: hypothetical protein IPM47_12170 [Sphingobacteriales bacterium]